MYAVKVEEERERARVRDYHSGFLPTYRPAFLPSPGSSANSRGVVNEKGVKRLVVPGYIFMLQNDPRSQPVSAAEWAIIEAVSDTRPSYFDPETGKVSVGPLTAVNHLINRVEGDRVRITARLLGTERHYWLKVSLSAPPESGESPEKKAKTVKEMKPEKAAKTKKTENKHQAEKKEKTARKEQTMNQNPEFTSEQKEAMLDRAEKVGIRAAAEEYGIPWQTLTWMRKKAAKAEAAAVGGVPAKAPKSAKTARGIKGESDLAVENALLREKNAKLEAKVKKLQKALAELIAD